MDKKIVFYIAVVVIALIAANHHFGWIVL